MFSPLETLNDNRDNDNDDNDNDDNDCLFLNMEERRSVFQCLVRRNVGEKFVGALFSVQVTDDVVETVADDEPFHAQHRVVAPHLIKYLLRQRHHRRLILDNHARLTVEAVEHRVAAPRHPVDGQRHLVAQQARWIALVLNQECREMLAHPLLRRQPHMPTPQRVEHRVATLSLLQPQFGRRQVQGRVGGPCFIFHAAKVQIKVKSEK